MMPDYEVEVLEDEPKTQIVRLQNRESVSESNWYQRFYGSGIQRKPQMDPRPSPKDMNKADIQILMSPNEVREFWNTVYRLYEKPHWRKKVTTEEFWKALSNEPRNKRTWETLQEFAYSQFERDPGFFNVNFPESTPIKTTDKRKSHRRKGMDDLVVIVESICRMGRLDTKASYWSSLQMNTSCLPQKSAEDIKALFEERILTDYPKLGIPPAVLKEFENILQMYNGGTKSATSDLVGSDSAAEEIDFVGLYGMKDNENTIEPPMKLVKLLDDALAPCPNNIEVQLATNLAEMDSIISEIRTKTSSKLDPGRRLAYSQFVGILSRLTQEFNKLKPTTALMSNNMGKGDVDFALETFVRHKEDSDPAVSGISKQAIKLTVLLRNLCRMIKICANCPKCCPQIEDILPK